MYRGRKWIYKSFILSQGQQMTKTYDQEMWWGLGQLVSFRSLLKSDIKKNKAENKTVCHKNAKVTSVPLTKNRYAGKQDYQLVCREKNPLHPHFHGPNLQMGKNNVVESHYWLDQTLKYCIRWIWNCTAHTCNTDIMFNIIHTLSW